MPQNNCKHEGCSCAIPKERADGYCSDYCQKHGSKEGHQKHACTCGHATCSK